MSTEYDGRQISEIKIRHMIDNAVRMGFSPEDLDDLEERAMECPRHRKKHRPLRKQAAYLGADI